jgi:2,4-dienoyl-CoA reductase-like NADH-dependent reductase (Old Yellow Enzyme family)
MATDKATPNGEVTDSLINHYAQRARSVGLLITEHSYVCFEGKLSRNQLGIYDDKLINGLSRLTREIHKKETPIVAQINHAGGRSTSKVTGAQPVGPSPVCAPENTEVPKEITRSEIERLVEAYRQAARRAVQAGYDAVEIHGAHGFLLSQFLSPLANRRSDEYGGPLENRMRFPLMIVETVRKELPLQFPLLYRLGADDRLAGGLTLNESTKAAKLLVEAGINALDISGGLCGSRPEGLENQGYYLYLAEKMRSVVDVPVIGVGGIKDPKFADETVRTGRADMVAVGRAILAEPNWALKAVETLSRSS